MNQQEIERLAEDAAQKVFPIYTNLPATTLHNTFSQETYKAGFLAGAQCREGEIAALSVENIRLSTEGNALVKPLAVENQKLRVLLEKAFKHWGGWVPADGNACKTFDEIREALNQNKEVGNE